MAVLLYYDGRRSIVSALRTLIQAREGVSWTLGLSPATLNLVTNFTNQLFEDGLVDKILALLTSINVDEELTRLGKGKGVGGPQHRQEIIDFVTEQRTGLAECLLYWACQNPFPEKETLKVLQYLQKVKVEETSGGFTHLDSTSLSLFHTLLACFNIGDHTAG